MSHILVGIGGTGGKILKAFRQRLWTEHCSELKNNMLPIGFIYVDTDDSMMDYSNVSYQTVNGNCCFSQSEFVNISGNVDAILSNPEAYPHLAKAIGDAVETQNAIGIMSGIGTGQKRRVGSLLFGAKIYTYRQILRDKITSLQRINVGDPINIHIFCGLAGGTGSGAIVDAIEQTRKLMSDYDVKEFSGFNITAYCQLPEKSPHPFWDTGRYHANGYGALLELNNLLTTNNGQSNRPASGLILYSNTDNLGHTASPDELNRLVADFVYTYIFSPKDNLGESFKRFITFEDDGTYRNEYDENADPKEGFPLPVRTHAIGSFGINRNPSIVSDSICGAVKQLNYGIYGDNNDAAKPSILEQLMNKYGHDSNTLSQFAKQLLSSTGVFLELDMNEITRTIENNPIPKIGANMLFKKIFITIPKTQDPKLLEFTDRFIHSLRDAASTGSAIYISRDGIDPNEISIIDTADHYPMRAVGIVPMLKERFDSLIAASPANRILLVGKGYAEDYPSLFAEPEKTPEELRESVAPYMILDLGLGRILFDAESSGQYGYTDGPDIFGTIEIKPWGFEKFSEMVFNDRFIEEYGKKIRRIYDDAMYEAFHNDTDSVETEDRLKILHQQMLEKVHKVIKEENIVSCMFEKWVNDAEKIILSYIPRKHPLRHT